MNNPTITLQLQGMRESIVNALVDYNDELTKVVEAEIDRQIEAFDLSNYIRNEVRIVLENMVKGALTRHIDYQLQREISDQVENIIAQKLSPTPNKNGM